MAGPNAWIDFQILRRTMKRSFLYLFILTVTTSRALQITSAANGNVKVRHTVIAASGDAAPAGGNYLLSSFSNVSLNSRHDVAFDASVGVTTGVFVGDGTTTSTTALGENPDQTKPSFGFVSNPFITTNGNVVFNVNNANIYRTDGKSIVPLVQIGDAAPGGGTVIDVTERATNDNGVVAYSAFVGDSTANQGIFRSDGTQTVAIVREDVSPPTGGSFTLVGKAVM